MPESEARRKREWMIDTQLRSRAITDERVLAAMARVPRERFVAEARGHSAYDDSPLPIGFGQTISQPYMVAAMLEALACEPQHRALEVGAGSGYQAALLAELCAQVWTVEIVEQLAAQAAATLRALGYSTAKVVVGDGTQGLPEHAPYDRIIVAAGAPSVPEPLLEQLAEGGRLVIPIGGRVGQRLVICRRESGRIHRCESMSCAFVPLIGLYGWSPGL